MEASTDPVASSGDVSRILEDLNEEQREAVTAPLGHALVLAGAGSGKTRVLTHRIAWLCAAEGFSPYAVLAVTFTNKAAQEMRERVEALLGVPATGMWLGTFHGVCHRILRTHWREAGLQQTFQVLDAEDQRRLVKRVTEGLNLDPASWPVKESQWFINARKEEGVRAGAFQPEDFRSRQLLSIYAAYEEKCRRAALVDFTELLLRALELLRDDEALHNRYREHFRCILVDEFQDTNALQYAWLRLLAGAGANEGTNSAATPVFAVGDDDQSIYGWRGARMKNIYDFGRHFPEATVYRLERNYRSTSTILAAANALIDNNRGRLGKNLWTDRGDGEPIRFFEAVNEREEAHFAAETVAAWVERGRAGEDAAILYRSNAQSRAVEEALISRGIAYRVYGGLRFFERAVIKDALAYLRLAVNSEDDPSYLRVINVPPRGIGDRTVERIQAVARANDVSLWRAGRSLLEGEELPARGQAALARFYELIGEMKQYAGRSELREAAERVIELSGLVAHHRRRNDEKSRSNVENLQEFIAAAAEFDQSWIAGEDGLRLLDAFLAHAALEAGGEPAPEADCVQLMTLHSAKGLEFPLVIIIGMEEELFPHLLSLAEPAELEEERRLCYVGVTRARELLMLTCAAARRRYNGEVRPAERSRFIGEIPEALIEEVRPRLNVRVPARNTGRHTVRSGTPGMDVGCGVRHPKFGRGVVLDHEGSGHSARVQVRFEDAGVKWLVLAYANLEPL